MRLVRRIFSHAPNSTPLNTGEHIAVGTNSPWTCWQLMYLPAGRVRGTSDRDLGSGVHPGPGGTVPVPLTQVDVEVPMRGRPAGGSGVKHGDEQVDPDGGGVDGAG